MFNKNQSDSILSKFYGLGPEGFPHALLRYRHLSGSPSKSVLQLSPAVSLNYHLVHTSILSIPLLECSRSFPQYHSNNCLSSFAEMVSISIRHSHSRKATLCTFSTAEKALQVYHITHQIMNNMSPRKKGQRLHAIVDRP